MTRAAPCMKISKPNVFRQDLWQEKAIADFIKLKTFLEGNILGVKLMILDLKKTKIKKILSVHLKLERFKKLGMKATTTKLIFLTLPSNRSQGQEF